MYIKIEIVHDGEPVIYEGDGFVAAWEAIRDAGGVLADLTAAELQLKATNVETLAQAMKDQREG